MSTYVSRTRRNDMTRSKRTSRSDSCGGKNGSSSSGSGGGSMNHCAVTDCCESSGPSARAAGGIVFACRECSPKAPGSGGAFGTTTSGGGSDFVTTTLGGSDPFGGGGASISPVASGSTSMSSVFAARIATSVRKRSSVIHSLASTRLTRTVGLSRPICAPLRSLRKLTGLLSAWVSGSRAIQISARSSMRRCYAHVDVCKVRRVRP